MFGLSQRYHQIQIFFQEAFSSQTWNLISGEFSHRLIISLHGFYGTFENKKIIKFFINVDINPRKMLKLAETKSTLWADAQILNKQKNKIVPHVEVTTLPSILGRWCFTYGSWKENDIFSGQGWLSTLERFDGLMGEKNVHASLSLLHAEMEALLWAMDCMRNLRQLVKIVLEPEE